MDYINSQQLPLGLAMGLAMDSDAMTRFANMTEAEKEKMIFEAKDSQSKEEMQRIIRSLDTASDNGQTDGSSFPSDIFQGPGIG